MPVNPINQRYQAQVTLDASGAGSCSITMRADFLLFRTRWLVQGGTGSNQSSVENYIDGVPFEGSQSGNNDQSNSVRLLDPSTIVTAEWTGGPPGAVATVYLWGIEYPAGQGMQAIAGGGGVPFGGSGPGNPILGGDTLIRDAIQSSDYVAGTSGWSIQRTGNAEFNQVTMRGDFIATGSNNSYVQIYNSAGNAEIDLYPGDNVGFSNSNPGIIDSSSYTANNPSDVFASLTIQSPLMVADGGPIPNIATLQLAQQTTDLATAAAVYCSGDFRAQNNIILDTATGDFIVNGISVGRGIIAGTSSTAASASISTTSATAVFTLSGVKFLNGRAYSIRYGGGAASPVSGTGADFRCFKSVSGVLGVEFGEFYRVPCSLGSAVVPAGGEIWVKNNTGADITTDVALTLASTTSGNSVSFQAGSNRARWFLIEDKCSATNPAMANVTVVS